jgi:hypothetical protein
MKIKYRYLVVFLSCLFAYTATHAQKTADFEGVWGGKGYQFNNNESWSIVITVTKKKAEIAYPSLGCSGMLKIIKANENSLKLKENIKDGAGSCVNNGTIVLEKINENTIRYKWYFEDGTPGSMGELIRF